ncbi:MAG TPA: hypothetical protein VJJ26_00250 [Candidatus Babeliales bacterium]|nr:hypothetical protein [Candidatus Babeliales bacterium]
MKIKQILHVVWSKISGNPVNEKLGFTCCFCNKSIMSLDRYPADLNVIVNIDKPKEQQHDQFFFCHTECCKKKLHENVKPLFILDRIND